MALTATLYRVRMDLSDVERGRYESLEFRVAQHPSEDEARLLARVVAYGLFYDQGLEFGRGISDTEEPALHLRDLTGRYQHWIDVGAPSAQRIHLASKASEKVSILAHKGEDALGRELGKRAIHRAEEVDVYLLDRSFVEPAASAITRNSDWTLVRTEGQIHLTIDEANFSSELRCLPVSQLFSGR